MNAKNLDKMVRAMRSRYTPCKTRSDIEDIFCDLINGIKATEFDKVDNELLVDMLNQVWDEFSTVDSGEIAKLGTFKEV